jgi:carboxyl-terminal processing protease
MTERISPAKRFLTLLAVLAGLFLLTARTPAEPIPGKQDRLIAQMVCGFLQQGHLNDLDPTKLYFLQSDVEEFKKQETELDDMILQGDLSFAYKVYERFLTRVAERQKLVEEFVNATHDFTANETLETDFAGIDYARTMDELRERWRKRIKFDLLMQRVAEKPVPEEEAKKKVLERYQGNLKRFKQLDNADLLEIYLSDLTTSIDPHSTYMSPATLDDFDIAMRLNLDGIGALLRSENGHTIVAEIVPGGAAAGDGRLLPNDKIVGVAQGDDKYTDTVDMKLREVVKLIRGKRGTRVQLKVVPTGKIEPVIYELTRQKIELTSQEARGDVVEQGKKADGKPYLVGVIDLPSFYADVKSGKDAKSGTEDVRKILKDFEAKHVDGVILDLRRNGGGSLKEALALTGLFIDQGPVVQVKGSKGNVQPQYDPEKGTVYAGPLLVLVSSFSASASEILAGALQDYGRALVVGDAATHGKGTVQAVIDLGGQLQADPPPKLGAVKLTIQQFYRVNGDSTQNRGVVSDIVLPSLAELVATPEKEMDYALPFDHVKPAEHDDLHLVPANLVAVLKGKSADRIKESKDFAKLAKDIAVFKERKARKAVPLNEKELREQLAKDDADKLEQKVNEVAPPETTGGGTAAYKFKRNYLNDEILKIMEDFLQESKRVPGR